jgi:uncharacterized protein
MQSTPFASDTRAPGKSYARSFLILIGFLLLGMAVGAVLGSLILLTFGHLPPGTDIITAPPDPRNWYPLMALQGVSHVTSFLLPTLLFWQLIERHRWADFSPRPLSLVAGLGVIALIVIAFMPFDGLIIEWNQALDLPPALDSTERWIREQEDRLAGLTKFLTTFQTPSQLVVALLVIGLIPAVGEETLFRGVVQRLLMGWTRNPHVGIWLSAALFSAIHVQFLGFFPRMLLGALFGYLYYWSGNLWVPILAHFTNNGFTVLMVWLHQRQLVGIDIENTDAVPLTVALPAGLLTAALLWYFWRVNRGVSRGVVKS